MLLLFFLFAFSISVSKSEEDCCDVCFNAYVPCNYSCQTLRPAEGGAAGDGTKFRHCRANCRMDLAECAFRCGPDCPRPNDVLIG
ncbi:hypothetical protein niasHT_022721 [Heterodera trifolii]|uniref:Uncharacterized protein n=1 Tax=Heterodera trifolii TaxID=157864 RepID=A0ABD2KN85_9BILA